MKNSMCVLSKGFTLLEILVVITIIGILAGFAVPAITGSLEKANQAKDLNNIKQLGTVLFLDANENAGVFRNTQAGSTNLASTATEVFQSLAADETLNNLSVLAGTGIKPATDTNFTKDNVAWDYCVKDATNALTVADGKSPLLLSYGATRVAGNLLTTNVIDLTGNVIGGSGANASLWGEKGVLVYYVGGNAAWVKAKDKKVTLDSFPAGTTNTVWAR